MTDTEFTLDSPPVRVYAVRETEHHYPIFVEVTDPDGQRRWEELCNQDAQPWPCRAAKVPHLPDGYCFVCENLIQVQIFRGDLWCCDDHWKEYLAEFKE